MLIFIINIDKCSFKCEKNIFLKIIDLTIKHFKYYILRKHASIARKISNLRVENRALDV